jgi:TolA-binding protein
VKKIINAVLSFYLALFALPLLRAKGGISNDNTIDPETAFGDGDRKNGDPLVLKKHQQVQVKDVHMLLAAHRSHSSHRSHRSHSSHRSGSSRASTHVYETPAQPPPPASPAQPPAQSDQNNVWTANNYYLLGKQFYMNDEYGKATVNFKKAVQADPGNPKYHHAVGLSLYKQSLYEPALTSLYNALKLAEFESEALKTKVQNDINMVKKAMGATE